MTSAEAFSELRMRITDRIAEYVEAALEEPARKNECLGFVSELQLVVSDIDEIKRMVE